MKKVWRGDVVKLFRGLLKTGEGLTLVIRIEEVGDDVDNFGGQSLRFETGSGRSVFRIASSLAVNIKGVNYSLLS